MLYVAVVFGNPTAERSLGNETARIRHQKATGTWT
jgi:hypothetical protein